MGISWKPNVNDSGWSSMMAATDGRYWTIQYSYRASVTRSANSHEALD
jgi:hypothetical protein